MNEHLKIYSVVGTSMLPYLKAEDLLIFHSHENVNDLKVGDLVLLQASNIKEVIVHRVTQLNPLKTKGDNLKRFDQELYDDIKIIGLAAKRLVNKESLQCVDITPSIYIKLIVSLSKLNQHKIILLHHLFGLTIRVFGKISREQEMKRTSK